MRLPFLLAVSLLVAACQSATSPSEPSCRCLPESAHVPVPQPLPAAPRSEWVGQPATWHELPGWTTDRLDEALPALARSCPLLTARYREWQSACAALPAPMASASEVRRWATTWLTPWRLFARLADTLQAEGLLTGYFEPVIAASRTPRPGYTVPIHAPPPDLVTVALESVAPQTQFLRLKGRVEGNRLIPYWSRGEITAQGAAFPAPVLFWAKDAVDLFFVHIQGAARLRLAEGEEARIGYADHNGHPYRSIGRALIDAGELPPHGASLAAIRAWLDRHPERRDALLATNPSYVFFRELAPPRGDPAIDGPIGTLGVPLVAGRSVAVDPQGFPLGAPLWLAAESAPQPLNRLVVAQDTGGAIRGGLRGDFYWGSGEEAGQLAERTRATARWWLLWPKEATPPLALLPHLPAATKR